MSRSNQQRGVGARRHTPKAIGATVWSDPIEGGMYSGDADSLTQRMTPTRGVTTFHLPRCMGLAREQVSSASSSAISCRVSPACSPTRPGSSFGFVRDCILSTCICSLSTYNDMVICYFVNTTIEIVGVSRESKYQEEFFRAAALKNSSWYLVPSCGVVSNSVLYSGFALS